MLKNPFFVISNYDIIKMIIYSRIEDWQHFFCDAENLRTPAENQGSAEKLRKKERADFKMSQLQQTHTSNITIVGFKKLYFYCLFITKV